MQLKELYSRFGLARKKPGSSRCPVCNGLIREVAKADILDRLEPKTIKYYEDFYVCGDCGKIYWEGSHLERFKARSGRVCLANAVFQVTSS